MVREMEIDKWFGNMWKNSRHRSLSRKPDRRVLGILAFEVSRLMSKVVNLWQSLTDRQITRLRDEIANSVGIRKLVSEDENYLMQLGLAEVIQNFESVAKLVSVLGKKCSDPTYHNLENVFDNTSEIDSKWFGWQYRLKKMERKVKKMDKFVGSTEQLYHEIEVLAELEQSLRRMKAGANTGRVKLFEFQQKVVWQRLEVKNLREMSPWVRSYDYIVRLLLRSLFTIFERIKYVYETIHIEGNEDYREIEIHSDLSGGFLRNNSMSPLQLTSVHPFVNNSSKFSLPLERTFSGVGLGSNKSISKNLRFNKLKGRRYATAGVTGCMASSESPFIKSCTLSRGNSFRSYAHSRNEMKGASLVPGSKNISFFNIKRLFLDALPSTLGHGTLALHYANIILLVNKLASSPPLISLDARDDLYNMLPATIRSCLRAKLKMFSRNSASYVFDSAFAVEWGLAVTRILEWLSPLAHNMVRWQSERNFERQRSVYGSSVLLVQTLHFANQEQTETAIVELLMGINYLYRYGQQVNERRLQESSCREAYNGYFHSKENMIYNMIGHMT